MLNETILIDFYEFTMAYGYFKSGFKEKIATFDLFFRKLPDSGGYAIFAGLESMLDYVENFRFSEEDINYLKQCNLFDDSFLEYLKGFKFTGDFYAIPEGTVIFPNEPIVTIKAPIIEAQLFETFLLQAFNHQSLIATKSSRLKTAAGEKIVIEMGARRAHGSSSANLGARAAYIGGIDATSNTMADRLYQVPAKGTMAHAWVQSFPSEYEAFKVYAREFPNHSTFLIDTYDTLKSGLPNAIKVIKEELVPIGAQNYAVRIDSGDLSYLSQKTREMLDQEGLNQCKIVVSNALDELLIDTLINQHAPIDAFGVGERLITAKSDPVFGGVYKLTSLHDGNSLEPKLKLSENIDKITTPGFKQVYRIYSEGYAQADLVTLFDEVIDTSQPLKIFDPLQPWLSKTFENYSVKPLLKQVFKSGVRLQNKVSIEKIKKHKDSSLNEFWPELKRFYFPHQYHVDLSEKLWHLKQNLIQTNKGKHI